MRIRVAKVNLDERKLDFVLADTADLVDDLDYPQKPSRATHRTGPATKPERSKKKKSKAKKHRRSKP
jgi:hypothetical protein